MHDRDDRLEPPASLSALYWNGSDERLRNLVRVQSMRCAWSPAVAFAGDQS